MKPKRPIDRATEAAERKIGRAPKDWNERILYAMGYAAGWRAAKREKRR